MKRQEATVPQMAPAGPRNIKRRGARENFTLSRQVCGPTFHLNLRYRGRSIAIVDT